MLVSIGFAVGFFVTFLLTMLAPAGMTRKRIFFDGVSEEAWASS
jgi:hypothetical protein